MSGDMALLEINREQGQCNIDHAYFANFSCNLYDDYIESLRIKCQAMSCISIKLDDARLAGWDETPKYKSCLHKAISGMSGIRDGLNIGILVFRVCFNSMCGSLFLIKDHLSHRYSTAQKQTLLGTQACIMIEFLCYLFIISKVILGPYALLTYSLESSYRLFPCIYSFQKGFYHHLLQIYLLLWFSFYSC